MITQLHIRNFAIITEVELEFNTGLSVVTGETGAGKSIIIDALQLVLGARADANVVRTGQDRCEINLSCDLTEIPTASEWLAEHELTENNECILRRVISKDGRSKAFINGTPCTLQQLRELGSYLISIHGQHQHQALLQKRYQLTLLDRYAGHDKLVSEVADLYSKYHDIAQHIVQLQEQQSDQAQVDLLRYQVSELSELAIGENEYDKLDQEQRQLANAEKYMNTTAAILNNLQDNSDNAALPQLYHAQQLLNNFKDDAVLKGAKECLQQAIVNCEEAYQEVSDFLNHSELNPEHLQEVEQRLTKIHDIARKHHVEPEQVYALQTSLLEKLDQFENGDKYLQELQQQLQKIKQQYFTAGKKLTKSRLTFSAELNNLISSKMQQLSMSGGRFEIQLEEFSDDTPRQQGCEAVTFLVSANPGQPLQPLNKVASGGEISRIALAIHVISAEKMTTPAMVFDEVDVGIGGSTAAMVGKLLRELGQHAQILCITHLAQVAACGEHHFSVRKHKDKNSTLTEVVALNATSRIEEIARMLAGTNITDKSLANAKDLMATATS